jgi:hypothetical protein
MGKNKACFVLPILPLAGKKIVIVYRGKTGKKSCLIMVEFFQPSAKSLHVREGEGKGEC